MIIARNDNPTALAGCEISTWRLIMKTNKSLMAAVLITLLVAIAPSFALAQSKPNIIFIMGDDIGMWNIGAYHRGMMAGRTPNIDKLAAEAKKNGWTMISMKNDWKTIFPNK